MTSGRTGSNRPACLPCSPSEQHERCRRRLRCDIGNRMNPENLDLARIVKLSTCPIQKGRGTVAYVCRVSCHRGCWCVCVCVCEPKPEGQPE